MNASGMGTRESKGQSQGRWLTSAFAWGSPLMEAG